MEYANETPLTEEEIQMVDILSRLEEIKNVCIHVETGITEVSRMVGEMLTVLRK